MHQHDGIFVPALACGPHLARRSDARQISGTNQAGPRSVKNTTEGQNETPPARAPRPLSDAARRALAEAEARRAVSAQSLPPEVNGRGGLEPVRYGDWEVRGLASDF